MRHTCSGRARLASILLLAVAFAAPSARAHDGEHLTLDGELEVIQLDDFEHARSERRYFLLDSRSGRRSELLFGADAPAGLRTGQRIRMRGRPHGPRAFHADAIATLGDEGASSGADTVAAAPEARRAVVLLVDLADASASSRYTLADLASAMWTGARSVDGLYRAASYDLVSFPPDADGDGFADAFGPFAIGASASSCDYSAWADAADAAAAAAGVDLSLYRHRVYALPRYDQLACSWAGLAQVGCGTTCRAWIAEAESPMVYAHELGHNVGMAHAGTDPENDGSVNSEYGDGSDPMGSSRAWHGFNAPHVDQMGWFGSQPGTLATVAEAGVYDLRPMSVHPLDAGGLRALKIAKPDTGGFYYLSFRQASGYDASLPGTFTQGVNIHRYSGSGYAVTSFVDSLATGESFVDAANGISVTQLARASDGSYVTVDVSFGCVAHAPSVAVTPASQSAQPEALLAYEVSVTNLDAAGCETSSFALAGSFPSGFSGTFGADSLALAPGATATTTLALATGAAEGSHSIGILASGAGGTGAASAVALLDASGPSAPALSAAVRKKTQIELSWSGASDGAGSGIASYLVHREGGAAPVEFATSSTRYVDAATSSGTTYTYTVRALDRVGNLGAPSNPASATPGSSGGGGKGGGKDAGRGGGGGGGVKRGR